MTTKVLSGTYAFGYTLRAPTTTLSIITTGYIGGVGLGVATGGSTYTIVNAGKVKGSTGEDGVGLFSGTTVILTNGSASDETALIEGALSGINTSYGVITNDAVIVGQAATYYGVRMASGRVINGGAADTYALIEGGTGVGIGGPGDVYNYGSILGDGAVNAGGEIAAGVAIADGGTLTNGAVNLPAARITGALGAYLAGAAGMVRNFGTILGSGSSASLVEAGVELKVGGEIANGSSAETSALITGQNGVVVFGTAGTVINQGTITTPANATYAGSGVYLGAGGTVTNGGVQTTSARIYGAVGVNILGAAGAVYNYGTITSGSAGQTGVYLHGGGVVINGSAHDTVAAIGGEGAGLIADGGALVTNFGEIFSFGDGVGLGGGTLVNGSVADTAAEIQADVGVLVTEKATVTNFGTIAATVYGVEDRAGGLINNLGAIGVGNAPATVAVYLNGGGAFTNGSASAATALTLGYDGVKVVGAAGTIVNFGKLGGVYGGVYLAVGGRITNGSTTDATALIDATYAVSLQGAATVTNFGTIEGSGFAVRLTGANESLLAEAGSLIDGQVEAGAGMVDAVAGVAAITGGLSAAGALEGAGTLALTGGTSVFDTGARLLAGEIAVSGATTTVDINGKLADAKVWVQTSGTLSVGSGDRMVFSGTGDSFSGTLTGAGDLAFDGGADSLKNLTLATATQSIDKAKVTLAGAITLKGVLDVTTPDLLIAATGASLTGGGTLDLSASGANAIGDAGTTGRLINVMDTLEGSGTVGGFGLILVNDAAGTIAAAGKIQLTLFTGAHVISNAGLIEAGTDTELELESDIDNAGVLAVGVGGDLVAMGAVSGAGSVRIDGGFANFEAAFSQNVTFGAQAGSALILADSQKYAGTISGFSKTGASALLLGDIDFGASTKASYAGTTTSGVLTVTDGTHTAKLKLLGDYLASTFTVSDDDGVTKVVDPTPTVGAVHAFVGAMASLGAPAGATAPAGREPWPVAQPTLSQPGRTSV